MKFKINQYFLYMDYDFQLTLDDVGQNLQINLWNLLFLVFLCNFRYFKFMTIISLFLGAFNAF